MRHYRWISLGVAIFLFFCFSAPVESQAASSKKSTPRTQVSQKAVQGKSVKSAKSKKTSTKTVKTASKTGTATPKNAAKTVNTAKNDRKVWLERAQKSEAFTGKASWYGRDFHNKATASGVKYDMYTFTAAHRTLPLGTIVKVTDQHNGKSVMVCVTDRGPYVNGRIIDVSYAAAKQLGLKDRGVGKVKLEVVSDEKGAPLKAGQAYFVRYATSQGKDTVGPFHAYADAAAMHEALRQAHPEAEVVLGHASGQ